ncbi:MAG: hypothetical protein ACP5M7_09440 [Thermoproteota archaeon]
MEEEEKFKGRFIITDSPYFQLDYEDFPFYIVHSAYPHGFELQKIVVKIKSGNFVSYVGDKENAKEISKLLGVEISVNKETVKLKTCDQMVHFIKKDGRKLKVEDTYETASLGQFWIILTTVYGDCENELI